MWRALYSSLHFSALFAGGFEAHRILTKPTLLLSQLKIKYFMNVAIGTKMVLITGFNARKMC